MDAGRITPVETLLYPPDINPESFSLRWYLRTGLDKEKARSSLEKGDFTRSLASNWKNWNNSL